MGPNIDPSLQNSTNTSNADERDKPETDFTNGGSHQADTGPQHDLTALIDNNQVDNMINDYVDWENYLGNTVERWDSPLENYSNSTPFPDLDLNNIFERTDDTIDNLNNNLDITNNVPQNLDAPNGNMDIPSAGLDILPGEMSRASDNMNILGNLSSHMDNSEALPAREGLSDSASLNSDQGPATANASSPNQSSPEAPPEQVDRRRHIHIAADGMRDLHFQCGNTVFYLSSSDIMQRIPRLFFMNESNRNRTERALFLKDADAMECIFRLAHGQTPNHIEEILSLEHICEVLHHHALHFGCVALVRDYVDERLNLLSKLGEWYGVEARVGRKAVVHARPAFHLVYNLAYTYGLVTHARNALRGLALDMASGAKPDEDMCNGESVTDRDLPENVRTYLRQIRQKIIGEISNLGPCTVRVFFDVDRTEEEYRPPGPNRPDVVEEDTRITLGEPKFHLHSQETLMACVEYLCTRVSMDKIPNNSNGGYGATMRENLRYILDHQPYLPADLHQLIVGRGDRLKQQHDLLMRVAPRTEHQEETPQATQESRTDSDSGAYPQPPQAPTTPAPTIRTGHLVGTLQATQESQTDSGRHLQPPQATTYLRPPQAPTTPAPTTGTGRQEETLPAIQENQTNPKSYPPPPPQASTGPAPFPSPYPAEFRNGRPFDFNEWLND
ncbi:hypothetical protein EJ08DRAFT_701246 [Tothia fuscella]|uniref:Uncharacterized protein n=1 Tax=Tothia fuscella TaxID=1048955 RepID=A0A9P4TUC7_9PEZI|nr:hypothetical protein EJ08DRAFT_701246 [Tothia fuscella]